VVSPAREGRYFEYISLNLVDFCSYPGPQIIKGFLPSPSCLDSFHGTFSLSELIHNCSFAEVPNGNFLDLEGKIHVSSIDPVASFRGRQVVRTTRSVLNLSLKLPSLLSINTTLLSVASPIDPLFAVTLQQYDYAADIATIEITSSVQWPYLLSSPSLSFTSTPSFNSSLSLQEEDCPSTESSACRQKTTLLLRNFRTEELACSFDGEHTIEWGFDCRAALITPCPVDGTGHVSANLTLESGDICGTAEITSSLTGELLPFSDGTFASEKISFLAGERVYLKASMSAEVAIASVELRELKVRQAGGEEKWLLQEGMPLSPLNQTVGLVVDEPNTGQGELGFSFLASYGVGEAYLFDAGREASFFSFSVQGSFLVTFRTTFGKRDYFAEEIDLEAHLVSHV